MTNDKLRILLNVHGSELRVTIPREDEEYYRLAAKQINDTINNYFSVFDREKSKEEIFYMAMLDIALRYQKEHARNDTAPFHSILGELTREIEDTL